LSAFPDSHVQRKFDLETAEEVRDEARSVRAEFTLAQGEEQRVAVLMDFDARLKVRGINPGTSADLTVACLLVHNLGVRLAQALG
jgi:triphosphoribosyl-dephospho-CoA synthase